MPLFSDIIYLFCYIHPSIPFKYGYWYIRIGRGYSHPPRFIPGMGMYANMMQTIPFMKHKSKHPIWLTTQKKIIVTIEKYIEK